MRKGFRRQPQRDEPATPGKNYITRSGLERLKDEHRFLLTRELSPVRFEGGNRRIAAFPSDFHRNAIWFLCDPAAESATCLGLMLRNKRSEKGKCVGEMSNWPGFRGWPNSEGLAIVWHQGDVPDQVRAQKGWQLTAWLPCSPPCEKNLPDQSCSPRPKRRFSDRSALAIFRSLDGLASGLSVPLGQSR